MMTTIDLETFRELLKTELPRMLREHPEARYEIWDLMLEAFPSREETNRLLEELRALREDTERHFEEVGRRFEQVDQRFESLENRMEAGFGEARREREAMHRELRGEIQEVRLAIDRMGSRWGIRNESIFRQTVTELLEKSFGAKVETRTIDGEEFDLIISDGEHIASIHSRRAQALRKAGFEVIEPEEEALE